MKWNYGMSVLLLVVVSAVCMAKETSLHNKKETQPSKLKQEKINHKQSSLGHWDVSSHSNNKAKSEHHAVKEVQKHAPFSVSHHEARTQLDLGHGKKKPLHGSAATKSELKMQDLIHEDAVNHKIQSHKLKSKHDEHGIRHEAEEHVKRNNGHHQGSSSSEKRERKPPKKVLLNKMKKNKRAKRLHKQYLF